ncbi:MAG: hypothetical protein IKL16_02320 [Clostridia bacterium]|nr:hypothetical protein [Clostridia bacterium]
MKRLSVKVMSVVLIFALLFSGGAMSVSAAETPATAVASAEDAGDAIMKVLYNALNVVCEALVSAICKIYPNAPEWQPMSEYDSEEVGFMAGRENYQTEAKEGNKWSLGYGSRSIVPEDIKDGKYYIGRDLTVRIAKDVYDDNRIRVTAIDDNSGEGVVVIGSVDSLGVTSADIRTVRKAIIAYCAEKNIKVASINITATHSHSALDTQGVATEFFRKLFGSFWSNLLGIRSELPGLEAAAEFKEFFIAQSIDAVKEAIDNMETGEMYFAEVDTSEYMHDKRDLIAKEDLQKTAVLHFVPDNEKSEGTYIADISCHATSFSASHGYITGDYIYYLDKFIRKQTGDNTVMVAGALGQVSRNIEYSEEGMDEFTALGAESDALGQAFGKLIIEADYGEPLPAVLNATHKEIFIKPENSILVLACEIRLVNNKVFYDGLLFKDFYMPSEIGYLEFGNEVAFALFPGELYPEVFLGNDITGGVTWDGTEWQYDDLSDEVDGIKTYAVSLANDALGYAVTDNNFAFMGHIIGEEIADEVLSIGKHIASFYVSNYLEMIEEMK